MGSNKEYTVINTPELEGRKIVCLTLDLEQDYGELLDEPTFEGVERIGEVVSFLKERNLPLTCFVQGSLFETHPTQMEQLATLDVDFELHSYSHPTPAKMNFEFEVKRGKEAYRKFFGKDPLGYRSPLAFFDTKTDYEILAANGFKFDSSICPSFRPGVFSNFDKPTKPYFVNNIGIIEFPIGILSTVVRMPAGLSYLKLFGSQFLSLLKTPTTLKHLIFSFHLHDLFELHSARKIPFEKYSFVYRKVFHRIYVEKQNGLPILEKFISICRQRQYIFSKMSSVYEMTADTLHEKAVADQRV